MSAQENQPEYRSPRHRSTISDKSVSDYFVGGGKAATDSSGLSSGSGSTAVASFGVTRIHEPVDPSCFGHLRSWKFCPPGSELLSGTPEQRYILFLPPLPIDSYGSGAQTDRWTRTGWTKAHVRHLIDSLVTWEHLVFGLLSRETFLLLPRASYNVLRQFRICQDVSDSPCAIAQIASSHESAKIAESLLREARSVWNESLKD